MPDLEELTWSLDEPFDNHMTLPRAVYLAAHRQGLKVVLDGVAGDVVLGEGSHIARLIRRGRWLTAYREASGQERFWGKTYPAWRELYRGTRSVFATPSVRRLHRRLLGPRRLRQRLQQNIRDSLINPDFAQQIRLDERLQILDGHGSGGLLTPYGKERAQAVDHPYLSVGRERYDRVASAVAVEPRDPFLDRRVVAFCLSLPGEQKLGDGWPKIVLRRAMAGRLPDAVRWRTGKEHLGWAFTSALIAKGKAEVYPPMAADRMLVAPYASTDRIRPTHPADVEDDHPGPHQNGYDADHLSAWLSIHQVRPRMAGSIPIQPDGLSYQQGEQ
jgi:asparagine synthase (glutamine-hydrolysing)